MEEITIVAVPFPAQGHLNQLLHFSLQLSQRHLTNIHYATSPSHLLQAKKRLQGWPPSSLHSITFHSLPSPPPPSPPPHPNTSSKYPIHLIPSFYASMDLKAPLSSLLQSLSATCRRLVLIHDPLMSFVCHLATSIPNAETFLFHCVPSYILSPPKIQSIREASPNLPEEFFEVLQLNEEDAFPVEIMEFLYKLDFDFSHSSGSLFNSCRAIEGEFIDQLAQTPPYGGKKTFLIGPLNPTDQTVTEPRHECLKWLDRQRARSIVYVSFGSTTVFSDEEIRELANGLKRSGHGFIWVVRVADRGDVSANEEGEGVEMEGKGMIVRGWAPQLEILGHGGVGAFMSHCGWNSCMESLSMGVPMLAWPMHSDQPRNSVMITRYLKAGIEVRGWSRWREVVLEEEIADVIKRMMDSDEGREVREKARVVGEEIRRSLLDGGSSKADFDAFVDYVCR